MRHAINDTVVALLVSFSLEITVTVGPPPRADSDIGGDLIILLSCDN